MNLVFRIFAAVFFFAAIYHMREAFGAKSASDIWFHVIFVFVDLVTSILLLVRPVWLAYFFLAFTLQQWFSHGKLAYHHWMQGSVDTTSIAVIIIMPSILLMLMIDQRSNSGSN